MPEAKRQRIAPWPKSWGKCALRYANVAMQLGLIGEVVRLPCEKVLPDRQYADRVGFLELVANRLERFDDEFRDTVYYRQKLAAKDKRTADMLARRFRNLFVSIRDKGFTPASPAAFPRVFIADGHVYRLHGAHRLSVLRFLGYKDVDCMAIVPADLTSKILVKTKHAWKKIKQRKLAYARRKNKAANSRGA